MASRWRTAVLLCAAIATATLSGTSRTELKVLCSGGFLAVYSEVLPGFERRTGIKVTTTQAASQGKTDSNTIGRRLARGEHADLVIMSKEGLAELIAEGRIAKGSEVDLAQTPLGVAVRVGAPLPDIGSVGAFKNFLLNAKSIGISSSTSGMYLETNLFPKLGIAEELKQKTSYANSAALVKGKIEVAVRPASELVPVPGLQYVGPIAAEIQFTSVFTAAIVEGSPNADAARRLIEYLASDRVAASLQKNAMGPLTGKRPSETLIFAE